MVPYLTFAVLTFAYWALIERRLRPGDYSVLDAFLNTFLARGGTQYNPYNVVLLVVTAVIGTMATFLLCIALDDRILRYLGSASLTIMCVHDPIKRIVIVLVSKILHVSSETARTNGLMLALIVGITIIIALIAHEVISRLLPEALGMPRKAVDPPQLTFRQESHDLPDTPTVPTTKYLVNYLIFFWAFLSIRTRILNMGCHCMCYACRSYLGRGVSPP